jgi:hypothetical protein
MVDTPHVRWYATGDRANVGRPAAASASIADLDRHCIRIEYSKKKDKKQVITFRKDETVRKDDVYKSHVVSVPSGEAPNSVSRPAAKRKPREVRPITQGKLLRKGGPSTAVRVVFCTGVI